jgi:hypothetical protein
MRMILCGIVLGAVGSAMIVANLSWVNWSENAWFPVVGFVLGNAGTAMLIAKRRKQLA